MEITTFIVYFLIYLSQKPYQFLKTGLSASFSDYKLFGLYRHM